MDQDLPQPSPAQPQPSPAQPSSASGPAVTPTAPAAPAAPAAAPRRSNARILNIALACALVLAVGGVAFAAGRVTAPAAPAGFRGGAFNGNGAFGPGASGAPGRGGLFGGGGATIEGTVDSVTDTTLTLKTTDGQTIQIALSGTTTYHAQTDASSSAVAAGGKVLVRIGFRGGQGTGNAPGSGNLSASDVTVVP